MEEEKKFPDERKAFFDLLKWFKGLNRFTCAACRESNRKSKLGMIATLPYEAKLMPGQIYMLCIECDKLPLKGLLERIEIYVAEEDTLQRHHEWFDTLENFLCVACSRPNAKKMLGKIDLFRPTKAYKKVIPTTYMTCADCEKLPPAEVYMKVEAWLVERGHIEL